MICGVRCPNKKGSLHTFLAMESDKPKQRPLSAQRTKQYIKIQNLDPRGEFTRRKSLTFAHLYLSSASLSRQPLSANQKLDCESGGHCEKSDV